MKFRDYAANETSLLVSRLLAKRAKRSVGDLQAFRQALDDAARAFEATLASSAKIEQDEELTEVVDRLTNAAAAQTQALSQREKAEAQAAIEGVRKEIERASKELAEHTRARAALDGELKGTREKLEERTRAAAALDTELKGTREKLEEHTRGRAALDGELKGTRKELEEQARAKAALDAELKGTRRELEEQARAKAALDGDVKSARKQVEDQARAKAALDTELNGARKEIEEYVRVKTALEAELKGARKEMDAQVRAKAAVDGELKESRAAQVAVNGELKEARAGQAASIAQLKESRAAQTTLNSELKESRAAQAALNGELKELRGAQAAHIAALDRANAEHERARRDLQVELDASVAAERLLRQRVADAERDIEHARGEAQTAAHDAVHAASGREKSATLLLDRLLTVSESLAIGTNVDDVLTSFVNALANDFSRVARFRVRGNRLEGVHQVGFDFKSDISKVAIPLTMDSLVTRAVASDRVEAFALRELADSIRAPLGGDPESALAVPLKVHDETVAVIYAEDANLAQDDAAAFGLRAKVAELLRRQAVPILEKLMLEPKVLAELQAYATLLLDEIEHMYTSAVSLGKKSAELKTDLKANLQCAREIYEQRVATQGPAAAAILDERLSAVLEARAATPFGRDLAATAGRVTAAPQPKSARQASQAS